MQADNTSTPTATHGADPSEVPAMATASGLTPVAGTDSTMTLAPGEVLFSEGDAGDRAYVVRSGRLEISRRFGSADVVIAIDGPGTIVGEMALIDNEPRSATVRALDPTVLTVVPKEAFQFHLARTDPVIRMLLERFVTIIRSISAENVRLILGIR